MTHEIEPPRVSLKREHVGDARVLDHHGFRRIRPDGTEENLPIEAAVTILGADFVAAVMSRKEAPGPRGRSRSWVLRTRLSFA
jgi:hypothetical protein